MYGLLLKNGEDQVKCTDCGGEGSLTVRGSLKVCKGCNGLGKVPVIEKAQRALRQFQQSKNYTVSHGHSVILRYSGLDVQTCLDDAFHALQALWLSGIKGARIIFPI